MIDQETEYEDVGDHNWVCPIGVSSVQLRLIGGGGAGGNNPGLASPGGGGGAQIFTTAIPVTRGVTYKIHVGSGGVPLDAEDGTFTDGAYSWFGTIFAAALAKAEGGETGSAGNAGRGGLASNSIGDTKYSGGSGGAADVALSTGGGGGSAAQSDANGADGAHGNVGGDGGVGTYWGSGGAGGYGTGDPGDPANTDAGDGLFWGGGGGGRGNDDRGFSLVHNSTSATPGNGYSGYADIFYQEPEYGIGADPGSVAVTGTSATLRKTTIASVPAGSVAVNGVNAKLEAHVILHVSAGSVAFTGTSAIVLHKDRLVPVPGTVAVTGTAAQAFVACRLVASSGSAATITGMSAVLKRALPLHASPGSAAVTGTNAVLKRQLRVVSSAGSVALTGISVGLKRSVKVSASAGAVALTGTNTTLRRSDKLLHSSPGSVTISGTSAALTIPHKTLDVLPGSVVVSSGPVVRFPFHYSLRVSSGAFVVTGTTAHIKKTLEYYPGNRAIGHGVLGIRSGMLDSGFMFEASIAEREVWAELRPAKLVTGWAPFSGNVYVAGVQQFHDGVVMDIVAINVPGMPFITRVESLTDMPDYSFYYDPEEAAGAARWDDGVTHWDDGVTHWDRFPGVSLNLGGTDPATLPVSVAFQVCVGPRASTHPTLGQNHFSNGSFEDGLTSWTNSSSGLTRAANTAVYRDGVSSLQFVATAAANNSYGGSNQVLTDLIVGKHYRLSGSYLVDGALAPRVAVDNGSGTEWIRANGRDIQTNDPRLHLHDTGGEWRRFIFDFKATQTSHRFTVAAYNESGAAVTGSVYFDGLALQRIFRFVPYEPRLAAGSVPTTDRGASDPFFGPKHTGTGTVSIINADGWLDELAGLDWLGQELRIYIGGSALDDQELTIDAMVQGFTGQLDSQDAADGVTSFEAMDATGLVHKELPERTYNLYNFPGVAVKMIGRGRAIFFGVQEGITPVLYSNGTVYGDYEIADCTDATDGIKAIDAIYAYLNEEAATNKDESLRVQLTAGDYSANLPTARFTILRDVGPYLITDELKFIDFNDGADKVAVVDKAAYTARTLALGIVAAMNAVSTNWSASYDEVTHFWTISRSAGTAILLCKSGVNRSEAIWTLIGFDTANDRNTGSPYVGDVTTFADPNTDHLLRVDAQGYKDDSDGSYTGTPDALIQLGPDIVRFIWHRFLGLDQSLINESSFLAARTLAPELLGFLIYQATSTQLIFETIERSCLSDIIIGGAGDIYFTVYTDAVEEGVPELVDADYLSWRPTRSRQDVYTRVEILYLKDPSTDASYTKEALTPAIAIRYRRAESKTFDTYLLDGNDAQLKAIQIAVLSAAAPWRLLVQVKGKLLGTRVGQKVRVTRTRDTMWLGLDRLAFRVLSTKQMWMEGITEALLIQDIPVNDTSTLGAVQSPFIPDPYVPTEVVPEEATPEEGIDDSGFGEETPVDTDMPADPDTVTDDGFDENEDGRVD